MDSCRPSHVTLQLVQTATLCWNLKMWYTRYYTSYRDVNNHVCLCVCIILWINWNWNKSQDTQTTTEHSESYIFVALKPPQVGQTCICSFTAHVFLTPTAGLSEATQNYHKAATTACHQGWRMDVTSQQNIQIFTEGKNRKLEKSFIHSLMLLQWCKVWLWPKVTRGVWVCIPLVTPGRFLQGTTSLNMHLLQTRQGFRTQPLSFEWLNSSYFLFSSLDLLYSK